MTDSTLDRRVRRTHQLLSNALIELTLDRGYDGLTIRDITDHADVAYATFFRHFNDKDDLLHMTLNTLIESIQDLKYEPQSVEFMYNEGVAIFYHVQQHCDLYRLLLDSQGAHHTVEKLKHTIADNMAQACVPYIKESLRHIPPSLITYQCATSTIALVSWWLSEDMATPPETMGVYYFDMAVSPLLDIENPTCFMLPRKTTSPSRSDH